MPPCVSKHFRCTAATCKWIFRVEQCTSMTLYGKPMMDAFDVQIERKWRRGL